MLMSTYNINYIHLLKYLIIVLSYNYRMDLLSCVLSLAVVELDYTINKKVLRQHVYMFSFVC